VIVSDQQGSDPLSAAFADRVPMVDQGQRSLTRYSGEGLHEELIVPTAAAAFHGQAVFTGMLFEQR
jgi:hypothetical protein